MFTEDQMVTKAAAEAVEEILEASATDGARSWFSIIHRKMKGLLNGSRIANRKHLRLRANAKRPAKDRAKG